MIHNFFLDFLKSFKTFISGRFPEINHFQFNYSDKGYLNYKLYKEHVIEFPHCHINLSDIRIGEDSNHSFFRKTGSLFNDNTLQHVCNNETREESVLLDFKWVTLMIDVKINTNSPIDTFNYINQVLSTFPQNYMFYDYIYNAYVSLDQVAQEWDINDVTDNVVYRAVDGEVKPYALYQNEPIFKVTSHSISKQKDTNSDGVSLSFEVQLNIPNIIGIASKTISKELSGIEIVLNTTGFNESLPILIDLDNNIYSNLQNKVEKIISLDDIDLDLINNKVKIKSILKDIMIDKNLGVYMIDDSTLKDPNVIFIEMGHYSLQELDSFIVDDNIELLIPEGNQSEFAEFNLTSLSFIEIIVFK